MMQNNNNDHNNNSNNNNDNNNKMPDPSGIRTQQSANRSTTSMGHRPRHIPGKPLKFAQLSFLRMNLANN